MQKKIISNIFQMMRVFKIFSQRKGGSRGHDDEMWDFSIRDFQRSPMNIFLKMIDFLRCEQCFDKTNMSGRKRQEKKFKMPS